MFFLGFEVSSNTFADCMLVRGDITGMEKINESPKRALAAN